MEKVSYLAERTNNQSHEHSHHPALRSHRRLAGRVLRHQGERRAIAGWLAGFFVIKEKGGLIWNIIIGLLGGVVGGWLLGKLGATGSFWAEWYGQIVSAVIGAVVLILVWRLIKKLLK